MTKFEHLYQYYQPTNYNLTLDIDRQNRAFDGTIIISGQTKTAQKTVKLHATDFEIKSVKIDNQEIGFDYQDNILSFVNPTDKPIEINYSGKINDQMNGLYPCHYSVDGQAKEMLATQFESHHAREVFPHIDEPIAKATFDLTLITEQNQTVLANTPIKEQIELGTKLKTVFETTPKMSSYILAFVIGQMIKKSAISKNGTIVNTFASIAHNESQLELALDFAVKALDFYEDYLGVKFPLPKCDHVALPDFESGAMENWGLITYRESMFLSEPDSSILTKKEVAKTISHELAHMWFGNLVTMKWWDELWLNESLATIMEHIAVDAIAPEYKVWQDFYDQKYNYARTRDSISGVQSVLTPVNHPDEINAVFDGAIVYAKGACLMLMLKNWVGEEVFQKSLHQYLTKFAHKNPSTDDFLVQFAKNTDKPVVHFMKTWVTQSGFPLVKVRKDNDKLIITQQSFLKDNSVWPIPLFIAGQDLLLVDKQLQIEADDALINEGVRGYYLTDYDLELKSKVLDKVSKQADLNSFYYLNNQILLAKDQQISSDQLVDDFARFSQKTDLVTWRSLNKIVDSIVFLIKKTPQEAKFKQLLLNSGLTKVLDKLGYQSRPSDSLEDTELRNIAVSLLSYAEDRFLIDFSIKSVDDRSVEDLAGLDAETRCFLISNKLRYDFDEKLFKQLFDICINTNNPEYQYDLIVALTDVKNQAAGQSILKQMANPKIIKPQDMFIWYIYLLRNRHQEAAAWSWLKDNFSQIRQTFYQRKGYIDFVNLTGSVFYSDDNKTQFVEAFAKYKDEPALKRTYQIALNSISDKNSLHKNQSQLVRDKIDDIIKI